MRYMIVIAYTMSSGVRMINFAFWVIAILIGCCTNALIGGRGLEWSVLLILVKMPLVVCYLKVNKT
jgi:hypothetical protein